MGGSRDRRAGRARGEQPGSGAWEVCERRAPYRAHYDSDGGDAITRRAERVVADANEASLRCLLELAERMQDQLEGDAKALWLELEEALHAHWQEIAAAHYDLGVERGAAIGAVAPKGHEPRARLYALARKLLDVADELE